MTDDTMRIELVQARLLLVIYDIFKNNPRKGWISASHCFHLVHLVKLDQIDSPAMKKKCRLSVVEIEDRRRTFWTAYVLDRYASFINGLPLTLNDQMILTRLPAPEAGEGPGPVTTEFLASAMSHHQSDHSLSPYSKSIMVVIILARCLSHQNQCNVERIMGTPQGCLARHRALDQILSREIQKVVTHFEPCDPTLLFIDMLAHAAFLVLFTALASVSTEEEQVNRTYEKRAHRAAGRIQNNTQNLSQLGVFKVHPFTPIALFICAEFVRSHQMPNHKTVPQLEVVSAAMSDLAPANNLAGMLELKLQRSANTIQVEGFE